MVAIPPLTNSTNVRSRFLLSDFLTPPRTERSVEERALLSVADETGVLPTGVPYWSWGTGPATLLVHGWGGRGTQLGALIAPLVESGRRVVTFDAPAHGDAPGSRTTLVGFADTIAQLAQRIGPLDTIIAHSFGAAATTVALARGLQASRVVFIAPMFRTGLAVDRYLAARDADAGERADFLAALAHANRGAAPEDLDGTALAFRMTAPLLVIHDRLDREIPHRDGEVAATSWPDARLVTTIGLGHRRILDDAHVVALARGFATGRDVHTFVLDDAARIDRELADRELRRRVTAS